MRCLLLLLAIIWSGPAMAGAGPVVSAPWLASVLGQENLVILDIRSRIGGGSRATFEAGHIPGAVYSDYLKAGWRARVDGVPGQLPPIADLEKLVGGLGIGNEVQVVIVAGGISAADIASATRVYWTFKVLGHDRVSILDGGHLAYRANGDYPLESGWRDPEPRSYQATPRLELVVYRDDVAEAMMNGGILIDNRPPAYFRGTAKIPAVTHAGTIPGAVNIPEHHLVDTQSKFITADFAEALHHEAGIRESGPSITFCNTGHWASLGWFVRSEIMGIEGVRLYDGSMADWTAVPAAAAKASKP